MPSPPPPARPKPVDEADDDSGGTTGANTRADNDHNSDDNDDSCAEFGLVLWDAHDTEARSRARLAKAEEERKQSLAALQAAQRRDHDAQQALRGFLATPTRRRRKRWQERHDSLQADVEDARRALQAARERDLRLQQLLQHAYHDFQAAVNDRRCAEEDLAAAEARRATHLDTPDSPAHDAVSL